MPASGHGVSAFSFSQVKVEGLRVEGAGHPVLSLQTKKSVHKRTGSPKTVAVAPGLMRVTLVANTCAGNLDANLRAAELVLVLLQRHDRCKISPVSRLLLMFP